MKQKTIKLFAVLMIAVMTITMATSVYANSISPATIGNSIDTSQGQQIQTFGGQIIGTLQVIGTLFSIGVLIVLGIKYMMGSAEEKAEYKKTMLPYVIGAILVFAAVTIANVIYTMANSYGG